MLQHFEKQRRLSPLNTKVVIVLPELIHSGVKICKVILDQYLMVHKYPAGTYLFDVAKPADEIQNAPNPTPWPVNVYLADHTVEDRQAQSAAAFESAVVVRLHAATSAAETYCNRTLMNLSTEMPSTTGRTEYAERTQRVRTSKPHQPRYEIEQCNLTNQQENNPLLVFSTKLVNPQI